MPDKTQTIEVPLRATQNVKLTEEKCPCAKGDTITGLDFTPVGECVRSGTHVGLYRIEDSWQQQKGCHKPRGQCDLHLATLVMSETDIDHTRSPLRHLVFAAAFI